MANSIDVKLNLIGKEAADDIVKIRGALDSVETAEGEVESAGKVMARALSRAASDIEADLKDSASAADALGAALGPELAAQVGRSGLDGFVQDLKRAGLTTDEIRADADQLAGAIKHLDDVGQQMDGLQGGLRRVGSELDTTHEKTTQNRSVMANWVGNTATELPGMTGMFGPLNMAIGQTAEYAAEGDINMRKMAGAGLAMAGVSLVVKSINDELAKQRKLEEDRNDRIAAYTKAIREGKDSIDDLATAAENADGKIISFTGHIGKTENITDELSRLGMTAQQFFELVKGGMPVIDDWSKNMQAAGVTGSDYNEVVRAAIVTAGEYETASKRAAEQVKVFGLTEDTVRKITDDVTTAQDKARDAADARREAQERLRQQEIDAIPTANDYFGSVLDLQSAYHDLEDQIAANLKVQGDATVADRDKQQSARDLMGAELDLGAQVYDTAQKFAVSKGAVDGSKQSIDLQVQSLLASKEQFPELATLIDDYITKLRAIPTDISTQFNVAGDIVGQRFGARADGGSTGAGGRFRVGERGPEDVYLPPNGLVVPADQSGPSGGNTYITQVLPHGARIDDLVTQATRRRNRRNGFT